MPEPAPLSWRAVPAPIGPLHLAADGPHLRLIRFADPDTALPGPPPAPGSLADAVLAEAARQLTEYLAGRREEFELPLAPRGSDLQRRVWWALREVPYGTTVTYGELADRLGLPTGSARAVGAALGANPLPVVLPCHRVIGAGGGLTGFAGGIARKTALLALEGAALL